MIKKLIAASIALVVLAAIIPVSLADSGDVKPYSGIIGADSPIYSIKIFVQNLDVALTFNNTDKLNKQMSYADERLSEAEAAALENNTGACDAALNEYQNEVYAANNTSQAPDINDTVYNNLSAMLIHHQQVFYAYMNNTTVPMTIQGRFMNVSGTLTKIKNGMPFYYYNGTAYFIPPGQMNKYNSTHMPPGLAKKGYIRPVPTITNGSTTWPWDQINYSYNTTINQKGHGHGNGNGNSNGNSNK